LATSPVLDVGTSLVEIHNEGKEGTGPAYKGGYGFQPLPFLADATGEVLSGMLRPGKARANTDRLVVTDEAIDQVPDEVAAGHHEGDDRVLVRREVVMRANSAGCTEDFLKASGAHHRILRRLSSKRTGGRGASTRPGWRSSGRMRCAKTTNCARAKQ